MISGAEWLEHRGSVGRAFTGSICITDEDGNEVPAGVEGEVWMKSDLESPSYRYIGAEAHEREGGWESLGDNGWLDEDGFLYLGDRTTDMNPYRRSECLPGRSRVGHLRAPRGAILCGDRATR